MWTNWLFKMPDTNYLLTVSWGYIKVNCVLMLEQKTTS